MAKRSIRHWTPRYIYSRIALEIIQRIHTRDPWLPRSAVEMLNQLLRPEDTGFEWGSGRSTSWFASRTKHLTSIDNSYDWYERVQILLKEQELTNVRYELHDTSSCDEESGYKSLYVQVISTFDDLTFDYILVDGWSRDHCSLASIRKLKMGGILIIDNANWYLVPPAWVRAPNTRSIEQGPRTEHWKLFQVFVQSWRRVWLTDGITSTLILIKSD